MKDQTYSQDLIQQLKHVRNDLNGLLAEINKMERNIQIWLAQKSEGYLSYEGEGSAPEQKDTGKEIDVDHFQAIDKLPDLAREILTLLPI